MKKILVLMGLTALLSGSAFADGVIRVNNQTNGRLVVHSYDWDDSVRWEPADTDRIDEGTQGSVTCKKTWTDSNAPGCYLVVQTEFSEHTIVNKKRYYNNTYTVTGSWKVENDTFSITSPLVFKGPEGSEITIKKNQLPDPSGGTTDCLFKGTDAVLANNGMARLKWQGDGNLVLYDSRGVQWATGTNPDAQLLCFKSNGAIYIIRGNHTPWETPTNNRGELLRLQKDCNLVILDSNDTIIWQTGTHCRN